MARHSRSWRGATLIATMPIDSLAGVRRAHRPRCTGASTGAARASALRAIVASPGDVEHRNDTLAAARATCRARRARCSCRRRPTSTRAIRSRCCAARSAFRRAGIFASRPGSGASKARSRRSPRRRCAQALREAPVAIMHGDTAAFGPPRSATQGSLLAVVTIGATEGEWYPVGRAGVAARAGAVRRDVGQPAAGRASRRDVAGRLGGR